jgi:hypothetical protein
VFVAALFVLEAPAPPLVMVLFPTPPLLLLVLLPMPVSLLDPLPVPPWFEHPASASAAHTTMISNFILLPFSIFD